ncbi:TioE family transcriptional regulator [Streptomyces huasconensis]|uniref:TioE family transcriptional regulator n=1 Tax=Streptomyces huasconensis TaxID=1854574 RepID=A0ABV3LTG8_9ACTN
MSRREAGRAGAGGAAAGTAAGAGPRGEGVARGEGGLARQAGAERLRPVDLARAAGVSTQQIRNYADAGVLPPAPRSPAGYRRFDDRHRQALLTYRALVRGHGPGTARAIMRAVHEGDVPQAFALIDAGHAALHEQRLSLRATGQALEAVAEGGPGAPALPRSRLRVGEVAAHLGVRTSALRVWESAGLLTPAREPGTGYRVYLPADVRDARVVHLLRQSHYLFAQIRPVLDDLRRSGGVEALRTALAQRETVLNGRTRAMLEGAGRLHAYLDTASRGPYGYPDTASDGPRDPFASSSLGPYSADSAPDDSAQ